MEPSLITVLCISYLFSTICVVRLWLKPGRMALKAIYTLILAVPVVGFILYLFAADTTKPQRDNLQNNPQVGGFGAYTQRWISMRPLYKETLWER